MRPVNLIPPEERVGTKTTGRSGVAGYIIIGALVIAIAVVAYVTSLGNKMDDHRAEIASLENEVADAQARANALQPYVDLANVRAARTVTIDSLAKSRFDWDSVLRELAKVTPSAISLSSVTGTVNPTVEVEGATPVALRTQVPGPALEIVGCATSQRQLADFISALHDIDGVTRVAASNSAKGDKPDKQEAAAADQGSSGAAASSECARPKDANFQVVAAFDAVPAPSEPAIGATGATTVASTTTTDDGGVGAEQASQAQQQQQISNASQRSEDATKLVPGG
jgi:Tfp pilus assembly protein PilN